MWSLCGFLTSAICVVSMIVNYLERSRVLGGREIVWSRRKTMTELMRQNEKRARCASLLKFGYVIFFFFHRSPIGLAKMNCRLWNIKEVSSARPSCAAANHSITAQIGSLHIRAVQHLLPASGCAESSLLWLIRKCVSCASLETRNLNTYPTPEA